MLNADPKWRTDVFLLLADLYKILSTEVFDVSDNEFELRLQIHDGEFKLADITTLLWIWDLINDKI